MDKVEVQIPLFEILTCGACAVGKHSHCYRDWCDCECGLMADEEDSFSDVQQLHPEDER